MVNRASVIIIQEYKIVKEFVNDSGVIKLCYLEHCRYENLDPDNKLYRNENDILIEDNKRHFVIWHQPLGTPTSKITVEDLHSLEESEKLFNQFVKSLESVKIYGINTK